MNDSGSAFVTDRVACVRADNPGIMTLDGTNTWILREPGAGRSVVVDPGPLDENHLRAVLDVAGEVGLVIATHRHDDHTEALQRFTELTGAPTRATDREFCSGGEPLVDGEQLEIDGLLIDVLATPGHTSDSTCLRLPADNSLLTGDTILGRGTTVVAYPDGALAPYLDSLALIRELIDEGMVDRLLPGHGPVITDPLAVVDGYIEHRHERLEQIRAAVIDGAESAREVVEKVYSDVDEILWPAAELSVAAQLDYLRQV